MPKSPSKTPNIDPVLKQKADRIAELEEQVRDLTEKRSESVKTIARMQSELDELRPMKQWAGERQKIIKELQQYKEGADKSIKELDAIKKRMDEVEKKKDKELVRLKSWFERCYALLLEAYADLQAEEGLAQHWRSRALAEIQDKLDRGQIREQLDQNYAALRDAIQLGVLNKAKVDSPLGIDPHRFPDATLFGLVAVAQEFGLQIKTDIKDKKKGSSSIYMKKGEGKPWERVQGPDGEPLDEDAWEMLKEEVAKKMGTELDEETLIKLGDMVAAGLGEVSKRRIIQEEDEKFAKVVEDSVAYASGLNMSETSSATGVVTATASGVSEE